VQYCVSLKTVVQPRTSGHMPCHGEFSDHQIPTFLVKILDKSDLMEHTHGTKNTIITKEKTGFTLVLLYTLHTFQTQEGREWLLSFMVTAVVRNFVTCYDIF